jgi:hypothetical protein
MKQVGNHLNNSQSSKINPVTGIPVPREMKAEGNTFGSHFRVAF